MRIVLSEYAESVVTTTDSVVCRGVGHGIVVDFDSCPVDVWCRDICAEVSWQDTGNSWRFGEGGAQRRSNMSVGTTCDSRMSTSCCVQRHF